MRKQFAIQWKSEVSRFVSHIKKNRDRNLSNLELLLKESIGLNFTDDRFAKLFGYLFNLQFSFEPELQEGLRLFYQFAERLGLGPRPKNLEFFQPEC